MFDNDSIDFSLDNDNLEDLVDNISSKQSYKGSIEFETSNELKFGFNNLAFIKEHSNHMNSERSKRSKQGLKDRNNLVPNMCIQNKSNSRSESNTVSDHVIKNNNTFDHQLHKDSILNTKERVDTKNSERKSDNNNEKIDDFNSQERPNVPILQESNKIYQTPHQETSLIDQRTNIKQSYAEMSACQAEGHAMNVQNENKPKDENGISGQIENNLEEKDKVMSEEINNRNNKLKEACEIKKETITHANEEKLDKHLENVCNIINVNENSHTIEEKQLLTNEPVNKEMINIWLSIIFSSILQKIHKSISIKEICETSHNKNGKSQLLSVKEVNEKEQVEINKNDVMKEIVEKENIIEEIRFKKEMEQSYVEFKLKNITDSFIKEIFNLSLNKYLESQYLMNYVSSSFEGDSIQNEEKVNAFTQVKNDTLINNNKKLEQLIERISQEYINNYIEEIFKESISKFKSESQSIFLNKIKKISERIDEYYRDQFFYRLVKLWEKKINEEQEKLRMSIIHQTEAKNSVEKLVGYLFSSVLERHRQAQTELASNCQVNTVKVETFEENNEQIVEFDVNHIKHFVGRMIEDIFSFSISKLQESAHIYQNKKKNEMDIEGQVDQIHLKNKNEMDIEGQVDQIQLIKKDENYNLNDEINVSNNLEEENTFKMKISEVTSCLFSSSIKRYNERLNEIKPTQIPVKENKEEIKEIKGIIKKEESKHEIILNDSNYLVKENEEKMIFIDKNADYHIKMVANKVSNSIFNKCLERYKSQHDSDLELYKKINIQIRKLTNDIFQTALNKNKINVGKSIKYDDQEENNFNKNNESLKDQNILYFEEREKILSESEKEANLKFQSNLDVDKIQIREEPKLNQEGLIVNDNDNKNFINCKKDIETYNNINMIISDSNEDLNPNTNNKLSGRNKLTSNELDKVAINPDEIDQKKVSSEEINEIKDDINFADLIEDNNENIETKLREQTIPNQLENIVINKTNSISKETNLKEEKVNEEIENHKEKNQDYNKNDSNELVKIDNTDKKVESNKQIEQVLSKNNMDNEFLEIRKENDIKDEISIKVNGTNEEDKKDITKEIHEVEKVFQENNNKSSNINKVTVDSGNKVLSQKLEDNLDEKKDIYLEDKNDINDKKWTDEIILIKNSSSDHKKVSEDVNKDLQNIENIKVSKEIDNKDEDIKEIQNNTNNKIDFNNDNKTIQGNDSNSENMEGKINMEETIQNSNIIIEKSDIKKNDKLKFDEDIDNSIKKYKENDMKSENNIKENKVNLSTKDIHNEINLGDQKQISLINKVNIEENKEEDQLNLIKKQSISHEEVKENKEAIKQIVHEDISNNIIDTIKNLKRLSSKHLNKQESIDELSKGTIDNRLNSGRNNKQINNEIKEDEYQSGSFKKLDTNQLTNKSLLPPKRFSSNRLIKEKVNSFYCSIKVINSSKRDSQQDFSRDLVPKDKDTIAEERDDAKKLKVEDNKFTDNKPSLNIVTNNINESDVKGESLIATNEIFKNNNEEKDCFSSNVLSYEDLNELEDPHDTNKLEIRLMDNNGDLNMSEKQKYIKKTTTRKFSGKPGEFDNNDEKTKENNDVIKDILNSKDISSIDSKEFEDSNNNYNGTKSITEQNSKKEEEIKVENQSKFKNADKLIVNKIDTKEFESLSFIKSGFTEEKKEQNIVNEFILFTNHQLLNNNIKEESKELMHSNKTNIKEENINSEDKGYNNIPQFNDNTNIIVNEDSGNIASKTFNEESLKNNINKKDTIKSKELSFSEVENYKENLSSLVSDLIELKKGEKTGIISKLFETERKKGNETKTFKENGNNKEQSEFLERRQRGNKTESMHKGIKIEKIMINDEVVINSETKEKEKLMNGMSKQETRENVLKEKYDVNGKFEINLEKELFVNGFASKLNSYKSILPIPKKSSEKVIKILINSKDKVTDSSKKLKNQHFSHDFHNNHVFSKSPNKLYNSLIKKGTLPKKLVVEQNPVKIEKNLLFDIKQFNHNFDENKLNLGKEEAMNYRAINSQLIRSDSKETTQDKKKFYNTSEKFYSRSLQKEKFVNPKQIPHSNSKNTKLLDCISNPKNPYSTSWGNKILLTRFKVKLAFDGFTNGLPNLKLVKAKNKKRSILENNSNIVMNLSKHHANKEETLNVKKSPNSEIFYKENLDIKPLTASTSKRIKELTSNKPENEVISNFNVNNNEIHFPYIISCLKKEC